MNIELRAKKYITLGINSLALAIAIGKNPKERPNTVRLGTEYGGYLIPIEYLSSGRKKVLVSAGLGFDISFDLSLIEHGFTVIGVEPVMESINWVRESIITENVSESYQLIPKAISRSGGVKEFHSPLLSRNYQWWANQNPLNIHRDTASFSCIAVLDVLELARSQSEIVIGKFDIEGSEIEIIQSIIEDNLIFDWLIIEMDYLNLVRSSNLVKRLYRAIKVKGLMRQLRKSGYIFVLNEEFNFFWLKV